MNKLKLNDRKWCNFKIGSIFDVTGSFTTHPSKLNGNGRTPRITCAATNNGLERTYNNEPTEKGGVLTVDSATIGCVSYQYNDFIATDHVEIIKRKNDKFMNEAVGMFVKSAIENSVASKYGYGYKFSQTRIKKQVISLPAVSNETPDWQFMEDYIKQEKKKLVDKVTEYYKNKITNLPMQAEYREYREFWLDDIVEVKSGVRLTKANQEIGRRPFIGASDSNNGITNFVNNTNSSSDKNILGVNYNGSVVENFYHPYKALFSDDVKRLEFKDVKLRNKYGYLFLKQSILMQKEKYTYGYKFNADRMRRQKIVLPIDSTGEIDFLFMMNTVRQSEKNLMLKIINHYEKK